MVTLLVPTSTCDRLLGLYSSCTPRVIRPYLLIPCTVTTRVDVPAFCVTVPRNFVPLEDSTMIHLVAEGILIAPPETATALPVILAVPFSSLPSDVLVLASRFPTLVPKGRFMPAIW